MSSNGSILQIEGIQGEAGKELVKGPGADVRSTLPAIHDILHSRTWQPERPVRSARRCVSGYVVGLKACLVQISSASQVFQEQVHYQYARFISKLLNVSCTGAFSLPC